MQFKIGDEVKLVIKEGEVPRFSWGMVKNGDIGKIVNIGSDEVSMSVDFPNQNCWKAEASELELVKGEMKMKKSDINERMLFKLRKGCMVVLLSKYNTSIFYAKDDLGERGGEADLNSYTEDLKNNVANKDYDIVAVKQYESQSEAIGQLLGNVEPEWEEIEEDIQKESSLRLWKSALERYEKISDIAFELQRGLKDEGNEKLDIKACAFCKKKYEDGSYCGDCDWAKVFGDCNKDGSKWKEVYEATSALRDLISDSTVNIQKQIDKLEQ